MQLKRMLAVCAFSLAGALAQEAGVQMKHVFTAAVPPPEGAGPAHDVVFISHEGFGLGKTIVNSPFSAKAVTQFTQTLADGTKVSRTNSAQLYRDTQGRTRREQTFDALGPWRATDSGGQPQKTISVIIEDPVAKQMLLYEANSNNKVVRRSQIADMPNEGEGWKRVMTTTGTFNTSMPGPGMGMATMAVSKHVQYDAPKSESLGTSEIEGVLAEGTRVSSTIPVGQIGNDREIVMTTETWYSPDLQMVVKRDSNDPMMGRTVYTVTNISRTEPSADLFQAPAGYEVQDAGVVGGVMGGVVGGVVGSGPTGSVSTKRR